MRMHVFPNDRARLIYLLAFVFCFAVVLGQGSETSEMPDTPEPCLNEPDSESLGLAFDAELLQFLGLEQEAYADVYTNLIYDYLPLISLEGTTGLVEASYTGSVTDIATGEVIAASGTIYARFNWQDCGWQLLAYWF